MLLTKFVQNILGLDYTGHYFKFDIEDFAKWIWYIYIYIWYQWDILVFQFYCIILRLDILDNFYYLVLDFSEISIDQMFMIILN